MKLFFVLCETNRECLLYQNNIVLISGIYIRFDCEQTSTVPIRLS